VCHCCDEIAPLFARPASAATPFSSPTPAAATPLWLETAKSLMAERQGKRLSPAFERQNQAPGGVSTGSERSNPAQVMSLKNNGDFLMHGVVLQIHVFRPVTR
jgi:hypothetical protein